MTVPMSVPMSAAPVLIAGAGPVGLCAGLHLANLGVPFLIFEDDGGLSTEPKAGVLLPSSLEIFAQLGVAERMVGEGVRCGTVEFLDGVSSRVVNRLHLHELATDTRYPMGLNLAQNDTERILRDEICALGLESALHFHHRVTGVVQDDDGVTLLVETPDGRKEYRGSHLLGCDGGRGAVRESIGVASTGRTYPETFAVFNVEFDSLAADLVRAPGTFVFSPEEWMILVRLPGFWRVVWPQQPGRPPATEADLAERLRFAFGRGEGFRIVGQGRYHVHHRYADRFRVGRTFLLGDAAHLVTPIGGLGLNTGLQDVNNLCWKLARVINGTAGPGLLDSYERERLPVARFIIGNMADRNRDQMMVREPWKRLLRNVLMGAQVRSWRHRWQLAYSRSLLGISYGAPAAAPRGLRAVMSVLRPDVPPAVARGSFAPDGQLHWPDGHLRHLHDLLGRDLIALTFADARVPHAVPDLGELPLRHYQISPVDVVPEAPPRAGLLVDLGGRVAARYRATAGTSYLLRPDGYVLDIAPAGRASTSFRQALATYLDTAGVDGERVGPAPLGASGPLTGSPATT
jgi:3-(3-hydroxy-phenyl)propionate hydroxylase